MLEEKNDNLQNADGTDQMETQSAITDQNLQDQINNQLAEDSEEGTIAENEQIPFKNYESLNMEELVEELSELLKHDSITAIKNHVEDIRKSFMNQFHHLIDEKRKEFYETNEATSEFEYHSPIKNKFDHLFDEFKSRRTKHFNQIQNQLKTNLAIKNELIDELKNLIDSGDNNISEMFKKFNDIKDRWKKSGSIPKDKYNLVWNNFHFHIDRFYELVHLDRELRDADFKHNLAQKLDLIERAKLLLDETDLNKGFRELQLLHRIWKEEVGPVDKEHSEKIWNDFSAITKQMHDKREAFFNQLREVELVNLEKKKAIITEIDALSNQTCHSHSDWQSLINKMEALRESFFKTGKVPTEVSESVWNEFKNVVRGFNARKNAFYKEIKNDQQINLEKKQALLDKAKSLANSDDFETTTPLMKQVQEDWKKIGHVPKKYSDSIWTEFKDVCNTYFDKFHESRKEELKHEVEAFEKKKDYLEKLKDFQLVGNHKEDLDAIKAHIATWKEFGRVPQNRRHIEGKFNKILDALFEKLSLSKKDSELMKFNNKLEQLSEGNDSRAIANEHQFIRRKIDELQNEINQLENNVLFISNAKNDNPFVKEVQKSIEKNKEELKLWKEKLKKLNEII